MSEIMDLDDAIASEAPRPRKGPACWTKRAESAFGDRWPKVVELFDEVRAGDRTAASVARILSKAGFATTGNSVNRHLRGDCGCSSDD